MHPHHDGSALHVSDPAPDLGDSVTVFLRVPHGSGTSRVHLRSTPDAEPAFAPCTVDRTDATDTWWRADLRAHNPVTSYRFLLDGGPAGYRWVNGAGVHDRDVTDRHDFRLVTHDPPPAWIADAVLYQIFPDRFATTHAAGSLPSWAAPADWTSPVSRDPELMSRQLYGGDLPGVTAHLDHVERLGATAVYLTPVFPAQSNHRYDAIAFDRVDPLLGGDAALAELAEAAHRRGIRLMCDITTNHCGSGHPWFRTAQSDPASIEAGFFLFGRHPEDYACWCGVRSLPKLDHRNAELRRRLYGGPDSVIARWLAPPYRLDGWRVDVANMTGRYQDVDLTHQIAREIRRTLGETNPDAYLLAEHAHDATDDLDGDGWHGTMNYAGFTRPVWQWLAEPGVDVDFNHQPGGLPVLPGTAVAATVREVTASMSWRAAAASVSLLDSHDTARFRTVVGADPDRVRVGLGLLATMPGVPLVFAGAEVGQLGVDGEDSRRPFPWDEAAWDRRTYDDHRDLLALRRAHPALRHGGLRWLHVGADTLVYLRETPQERLLIQASRAAHPPVPLPAALGPGEPVYGADPFKDAGVLPGSGPAFRVWQLD